MSIEALNTSGEAKQARFQDFVGHAATMPEITPPPLFSHTFEAPATAAKIHEVRHELDSALGVDSMSLIGIGASELITNSFLHGRPGRIAVGKAGEAENPVIVVQVSDTGEAPVHEVDKARPDQEFEGGLGLEIITASTDMYGRNGNTSWFAMPSTEMAA
jgi:anti-sigma regulatory factor (Ser/Thr protein kinase)